MNLNDKVVLLTGASGGIGQALAWSLAEQGARLWLVGRSASKLYSLCQQLPNPERHHVVIVTEYTDGEIERLAAHFTGDNKLDALINNAGTSCFALFEQQSFADIREQIHANVELPLLLTRSLMGKFNSGGIILNVGSIFGEIGHPAWSVYSATKAATHRFSEALGRELAESGLSVLYVAPRATETPLNSDEVNALNEQLGNRSDSPHFVAQQIVRALHHEQKRTRLGGAEKCFVKINAWFPSLVDGALAKKLSVIQFFARRSVRGVTQ